MSNEVNISVKATDSASTAFGGIADNAKSMSAKVGGYVSDLGSKIGGEVGNIVSEFGEGFEKMSETGASTFGKISAGSAVLAGVGVALQAFASKGVQAEQQLKAQVDASGESWDDYEKQVSKAVDSEVKYAHDAADTQDALRTLDAATGDMDLSLSDLNVVTDLAAAKHISLADAASLVAKIYGGSSKTLKQFGIDMTVTAGNTDEASAAIAALSQKLSGQADASADTFTGKIDAAKTAVSNFAEKAASFAAGPLTYVSTAVSVVSGVVDIMSARASKAAASELELAAATSAEAASAEAAAVANTENAAATEAAGAAAGSSKLGMLGFGGAMTASVAAVVAGGFALSNWIDGGKVAMSVMTNLSKTTGDLTQAFQADGNMLGDNSKAALEAQLQQDGLAAKAAKAGITVGQLSTALMGNNDSMKALIASWQAGGKPSDDTIAALVAMYASVNNVTPATANLADTVVTTTSDIADMAHATDDASSEFKQGADKVTAYKNATQQLEDATTSLYVSQLSLGDSIQNVSDGFKKNGMSLDQNTQAGRTNIEQVMDSITKINDLTTTYENQGLTTDQVNQKLTENEQALIATGGQSVTAKAQIKNLIDQYAQTPTAIETQVTVNDSQALAAITDFGKALDYYAGVLSRNVGEAMKLAAIVDSIGGTSAAASRLNYYAGGIVGGAATGGVKSGMKWVGEHGPELVRLPAGSNVYSAPDSERMAAGGGPGGGAVHLTIDSAGGSMNDFLVSVMRDAIRVRGGNVQTALGN